MSALQLLWHGVTLSTSQPYVHCLFFFLLQSSLEYQGSLFIMGLTFTLQNVFKFSSNPKEKDVSV